MSELTLNALTAIGSVDGRYAGKTAMLRSIFSEYALIRYRVMLQIEWFIFLSLCEDIAEFPALSDAQQAALRALYENFSVSDAARVKEIERTTNHDVKATEFYVVEKLPGLGLSLYENFVHFALTSEDLTNMSVALMLAAGNEVVIELIEEIYNILDLRAMEYADLPMMSRTHGQSATPTTLGKEYRNFHIRVGRQSESLRDYVGRVKWNGASGNYNAHDVAYPEVNWVSLSSEFIGEVADRMQVKLEVELWTTQIEPHDTYAELFHSYVRMMTILTDLSRDFWSYISLDYFKQRQVEGEVGSSTMPHKVNPIDFENAEGNFGLATALFENLAHKLPVSRWQRDLTDSTTIRAFGTTFGWLVIALQSLIRGLKKLEVNEVKIAEDLENNPQLLAEAIQMVMRRHGFEKPYQQLKSLTRGRSSTLWGIREFIETLDGLPNDVRGGLLALTPATYTGLAKELAQADYC